MVSLNMCTVHFIGDLERSVIFQTLNVQKNSCAYNSKKKTQLLYSSINETMKWQYFFKPQICNIFVHCAEGLYLVQIKQISQANLTRMPTVVL